VSAEDLGRVLKRDEQGVFFQGDEGGCPFLDENACTIYDCRPNVCWEFPIMGGQDRTLNGQPVKQMMFRLMCQPGAEVARILFQEATANGNSILLPDLTIVQKIKKEELS